MAVPDAGQGRIPEWSANPAGAQAGHQQADRRRAGIDRRGDVDLAVFQAIKCTEHGSGPKGRAITGRVAVYDYRILFVFDVLLIIGENYFNR